MHPFTPQQIANSGLSGAGGVDQGAYNDCVFEASMAAIATTATGQAAISQMIVQNPDGSYTVTFPGNAQSPVTVTQANITATGVTDSATWADVLETALLLSNPEFANGAAVPPNAKCTPNGVAPTPAQYALHLLTGNPANKDVASSPTIGMEINLALRVGQPVIAFCANNDNNALVSGHEWTVIACNTQTNQIILRNPWGNFGTAGTSSNGVTYDGNAEVTMPLSAFAQYYGEVTFGNAPLGLVNQITLPQTSANSPALASLNGLLFMAWAQAGNNQLNVNCSPDGILFAGLATSSDTSLQAPALCAAAENLYLAWTGFPNNELNLCQVNFLGDVVTGFSNKITLTETSSFAPVLASINGLIYLAWTGLGNNQLNIAVSTNYGGSFVGKYTSPLTAQAAPALCVQNGVLYIAWVGTASDNLNVGQVTISDGLNPNIIGISNITNVVTLPDTSKTAPALASNGNLYLGWKGDGNPDINVERFTDGGLTFTNKFTPSETTVAAPALGRFNGSIYVAWAGDPNLQLNVARING
jgi:hypothetical protein